MCVFQNKLKSLGAILLGVVLLSSLILESAAQSRGNRGIEVEPVTSNYSENSAGLFIGINDFDDGEVQNLSYAVNDAISLAHCFVATLKIIPAKNCYLAVSEKDRETLDAKRALQLQELKDAGMDLEKQVMEPTWGNILIKTKQITEASTSTSKSSAPGHAKNLVIFSVSSHGVEVQENNQSQTYFLAKNSNYHPGDVELKKEFIKKSAVPLSSIQGYLDSERVGRGLIIFDACRDQITATKNASGGDETNVAGSVIDSWKDYEGLGLLISCQKGQVSYEENQFKHGVFVHFLLEALNGDLEKLNGDFLTLGDLIGAADDKVKDWTKSTKASVQLPELIGSEDYRDFPLAAAKRRMITIDERFAEVLKKIDAPYFLSVSATRELYNIYFDARETQNWDVLEPLIEALEKILPSDPVSTQQFIGYWTENKDRWVKKKEEPRPERPLELPVPGKPFQIPSLGLEFVWIPAGSFWMGSPSTETGRGSDEKRHYVQISQGFWMAKYEMTIESFTHFVEETGHVTEAEKNDEGLRGWNGKEFIFLKGENWRNTLNAGPTYPVVGVSWNDAVAYCEWLNEKQKRLGRLPAGYAFQLPTEAQWEYACRAGSTGPVYIEGEWEILGKNNAPLLDEISWYGGNSGVEYRPAFNSKDWPEKQYNHVAAGTHPVGQKQPNDFGLNDMLGNVWEWTADIYGAYPDSSYQQPLLDPVGPASGSYRVLRGGSWIDDALICRSAFRDRLTPSDRGSIIGFRLSLRSASFR